MITFLKIPEAGNDWENPRLNIDHIVSYRHITDLPSINDMSVAGRSFIEFKLINGDSHKMFLDNLDGKKIISKIDKQMKILKFDITKSDAK